MNEFDNYEQESQPINIKEYYYILLHHWYWIVLGLVLAMAGVYAYLRYAPTVYSVSSVVMLADPQQGGITEEALLGDLGFKTKSPVEDQMQVLKSTNLMRRVVDSLGLGKRFISIGRVRSSDVYQTFDLIRLDSLTSSFRLEMEVIDSTTYRIRKNKDDEAIVCRFGAPVRLDDYMFIIKNKGKNIPDSKFDVVSYNPTEITRLYANTLNIEKLKQTNVLKMTLQDGIPERAEDILNQLIIAYNEVVIDDKNQAGKNTLAFIDERLTYIAEELYDVEKDVQTYKQDNKVPIDVSGAATEYLTQVNALDGQMMEIDVQKGLLDNIRSLMNDSEKQYKPLPGNAQILGAGTGELIGQYNQLLLKRSTLLEAATSANPAVNTFDEQLDFIRESLNASVNNLSRELNSRKNTLQQRLSPIERRIGAVPRNERELLQIMRQQKIKETLFLFLLQKREETSLSIAAQTPSARFLNNPINNGPISPKKQNAWLIGLLLGLGLPIGIILLRKSLDTKVYTREDIERITDMPFLGTIGNHPGGKNKSFVAIKKGSRSSVAEMFRLLRTNLSYSGVGTDQKVILVTSNISGEGKTFITINLGITQALAGKKTIILGFDLRKPKLAKYISGEDETTGITNFLVNSHQSLQTLIKKVPGNDNLYYLPCGPTPPNPSELILQPRCKELFDALRAEFDCVLVDTAPLGLVTDALLLMPIADQTLIVSRFGVTQKPFIRMVNDLYTSEKLTRPGIILNGVKKEGGYGYGYGYGYRYGYGYGYYDDDDVDKKG